MLDVEMTQQTVMMSFSERERELEEKFDMRKMMITLFQSEKLKCKESELSTIFE